MDIPSDKRYRCDNFLFSGLERLFLVEDDNKHSSQMYCLKTNIGNGLNLYLLTSNSDVYTSICSLFEMGCFAIRSNYFNTFIICLSFCSSLYTISKMSFIKTACLKFSIFCCCGGEITNKNIELTDQGKHKSNQFV